MDNRYNPRYKNGSFRRKIRTRFKSMDAPCHICGKPIRYDEPSNYEHPFSLVVDEIKPCSRWREFGYDSIEQACQDINNLAPAHYICNAQKSNKTLEELRTKPKINILDGAW